MLSSEDALDMAKSVFALDEVISDKGEELTKLKAERKSLVQEMLDLAVDGQLNLPIGGEDED